MSKAGAILLLSWIMAIAVPLGGDARGESRALPLGGIGFVPVGPSDKPFLRLFVTDGGSINDRQRQWLGGGLAPLVILRQEPAKIVDMATYLRSRWHRSLSAPEAGSYWVRSWVGDKVEEGYLTPSEMVSVVRNVETWALTDNQKEMLRGLSRRLR